MRARPAFLFKTVKRKNQLPLATFGFVFKSVAEGVSQKRVIKGLAEWTKGVY